jgi:hypothetical protein
MAQGHRKGGRCQPECRYCSDYSKLHVSVNWVPFHGLDLFIQWPCCFNSEGALLISLTLAPDLQATCYDVTGLVVSYGHDSQKMLAGLVYDMSAIVLYFQASF